MFGFSLKKVEGCERRGAGSFELNPSLHELKHTNTRLTQKTSWTHDKNCVPCTKVLVIEA